VVQGAVRGLGSDVIITQTPARISFLGGGTDYPAHYRRHGGATLTVTIDKYTIITVHRLTQFSDHRFRIHYSRIESVENLEEIAHRSARECLRFFGLENGVEVHYVSDLPARTGLGSSSAATVGLLHALHAFTGHMVSREQLAAEAVHIEQEAIERNRVGSQDQYACALGGLRHLQFDPQGGVRADPIILAPKRLQALRDHLLLLYTGVQRDAHEVLGEQLERMAAGAITANLEQLKALVGQGVEVLTGSGDLTAFGQLLHEGWMIKRELSSKVTTPSIDTAYERARAAGAIGGKLLGAGGGGFLLLYVRPSERERVRSVLPDFLEASFDFEHNGSQVIFYRP